MISFSRIKDRFTGRAPMSQMNSTVRNLAQSFAGSPTGSPERTPRVARNLNRATNEAENAIAIVGNARSRYPVVNDDDDQDEKYDNPPAYHRQEAGERRQAVNELNARQSEEHQRISPDGELKLAAQSYISRRRRALWGIDPDIDDLDVGLTDEILGCCVQ